MLAVPTARMGAPQSGSDNKLTFLWETHEASTIKTLFVDLLRIHALHFRQFY